MVGSVFWETLRRELRGTLLWCAGLAFLGMVTVMVLPDAAGMEQFIEGLSALPSFLWQLLGVEDLTVLATPAGYIGLRYFLIAGVITCAWAVMAGMNVTVNDETRGISNMVVSLPLPRSRIIVEKILASIPLALLVPIGGFVGIVLGIAINPNAQTELGPIFVASMALTPVAVLVMSLTAAVGAFVPNRAIVTGVGGGFIAASFLLKSVAGLAKSDLADMMAQFSIFSYADGLKIIRNGFPLIPTLIVLAIAAGLVVFAAGRFQSRDLAA